jgi:hypothetical protein
MITLEQAKNLKRGDVLVNQDGKRWRVNGQVKVWKRSPSRVSVPVKHGLWACDYLTEDALDIVKMEGE